MKRRDFIWGTAAGVVLTATPLRLAYPRQRLFDDEPPEIIAPAPWPEGEVPIWAALAANGKPISEWKWVEDYEKKTTWVAFGKATWKIGERRPPPITSVLLAFEWKRVLDGTWKRGEPPETITDRWTFVSVPKMAPLYPNGGDVTVEWSNPRLVFDFE